jgi:3-oxoadipate enol-lactonase
VTIFHELEGSGPTVLFLHDGIADSRVWEPQRSSFSPRYRLLLCDLPGFGRTPIQTLPVAYGRDVASLLDELEFSSAGVVGCSLGGRVALELALARPDLVSCLVLVGTGLPKTAWSPAVRAYG